MKLVVIGMLASQINLSDFQRLHSSHSQNTEIWGDGGSDTVSQKCLLLLVQRPRLPPSQEIPLRQENPF